MSATAARASACHAAGARLQRLGQRGPLALGGRQARRGARLAGRSQARRAARILRAPERRGRARAPCLRLRRAQLPAARGAGRPRSLRACPGKNAARLRCKGQRKRHCSLLRCPALRRRPACWASSSVVAPAETNCVPRACQPPDTRCRADPGARSPAARGAGAACRAGASARWPSCPRPRPPPAAAAPSGGRPGAAAAPSRPQAMRCRSSAAAAPSQPQAMRCRVSAVRSLGTALHCSHAAHSGEKQALRAARHAALSRGSCRGLRRRRRAAHRRGEQALVVVVGHELRGRVREDPDDVGAVALPERQRALLPAGAAPPRSRPRAGRVLGQAPAQSAQRSAWLHSFMFRVGFLTRVG